MNRIRILEGSGPKRILAVGAHPDDIEIGCGGTILQLAVEHADLEVLWAVFCATAERAEEARRSAGAFLEGVRNARVFIRDYRDGFLPYAGAAVKDDFEALKSDFAPDVVFTHYRDDRHQDHRVVSDLTWNTWRDHLILEYEIPKYDGDFGSPNLFFPLSRVILEKKIDLVLEHFASQTGKHWFTRDLMQGVSRVRGMECSAPEQVAEGFYARKISL